MAQEHGPRAAGIAFSALFAAVVLLLTLGPAGRAGAQAVRLGVDVLEDDGFEALRGMRVGLIVNPASVNGRLEPTVDVLVRGDAAGRFELVALFGPEHGVYGDVYAGDKVADQVDPRTGLPVRSLYGQTRKPTPEMLADLDVLVLDLQDIGARSYTFISTMRLALEACIEQGKAFVVLDRPNPLGGQRVEGPARQPGYESFISQLDVPYVHGMTMGELARLSRDEIDPAYDKLTVVKMAGWDRAMLWQDTGLRWVPTSPHIPTVSSIAAYTATGMIGELLVVSNGVGYTLPFELVGSPDTNGDALAVRLEALGLAGVTFRSARFKPFYATFKGEPCQGVQVHLDPKAAGSLVAINFHVLEAMDAPKLLAKATERHRMFDLSNGSDREREWLAAGKPLDGLFALWAAECAAFEAKRAPYLLY